MSDRPPRSSNGQLVTASHRRNYQACTECRTAKVKCNLGNPDRPRSPPCSRCARSGRDCIFAGAYKRKLRDADRVPEQRNFAFSPTMADQSTSQEPVHSPDPSHTRQYDTRLMSEVELQNPSDALRILAAVSTEDHPGSIETSHPEDQHGPRCGWEDWQPVQEGRLTADDASNLFNLFFTSLHPRYPLLPAELQDSQQLSDLIGKNGILPAVILCIAARYAQGTNAPKIHEVAYGMVVERLAYVLACDPELRSIDTVESLLLLAEWPPQSRLMSKRKSGTRTPDTIEASNLYDHFSWGMIGTAVRLAQDLSLNVEDSYVKEDAVKDWQLRRRFNTWIFCHEADRHVSVRLGRGTMVQQMSTRWWESIDRSTRAPGDPSFPFPRAQNWFLENRAYAELTHTLGVMQDALYSSAETTADLLATGRMESVLHRLKPELDSLWAWHSVINGNDELGSLRLRMEFDYVRLYANAISLRAAQQRVLRRLKAFTPMPQIFDGNVLRSTEGPFILEAVDSATGLLQGAIRMHELGVLTVCPARVFLRMTFAAVFLIKAITFGAVRHNEREITELQNRVVRALDESSVDMDHMAGRFASLLRHLLQTPPPRGGVQNRDAMEFAASGEIGDLAFQSQDDALHLAELIGQTAREQDQILANFWGGTGEGIDTNLLSSLSSVDAFHDIEAFFEN